MADTRLQVVIDAKNNLSKQLDVARKDLKQTTADVKEMGVTFTATAIAGAAAIVSFAKSAGQMEQSQIAFETMLGSATAATELLEDLAQFAKTTPFEFVGIQQTAKQLMAMGIETEKIIPTLKSLGDVSAGLSVPIEQVALAFGQVKAANQLMGTELRQFVMAGVPLLGELADMFSVTEAEVKKMVEQGRVGFADVEQAFANMSGEGGKFFNLMDKQSESLLGQWSNLQDSVELLKIAIGDALLPALKSMVGVMVSVAEAVQIFVENNPGITKVLGKILILVTTISAIGAGIIAATLALKGFNIAILATSKATLGLVIKLLSLKTGMISFSAVSTAVTGKMAAMKAAFLALNPVMLAIAAVVAAVAIVWNKVKKAKEEAMAITDKMIAKADEEADRYTASIELLNGVDKERAKMRNDLRQKGFELDKALAEKTQLILDKADKKDIKRAEDKIARIKQELYIQTRANREKVKDFEDADRKILVSDTNLADALMRNGEEETANRLRLIEEYGVKNADMQNRIMLLQGTVSGEIIRLMQAQHLEQEVMSAELKAKLDAIHSVPVVQEVLIDPKPAWEATQTIATGVWDMKKAAVDAEVEINKKMSSVTEGFKNVGKGASGAKSNVGKFAKDTIDDLNKLIGKISTVQERIADLTGEFIEKEKEDRMKLATEIVDTEKKITDLTKQEEDAKKAVREATDADARRAAQDRLLEIQNDLTLEQEAYQRHTDLIKQFDDETNEVRRQNALSALEKAIETFNKEREQAQITFDEKMQLLQDELAELEVQKEDIIAIVEEKNLLLNDKYKEDTANLLSQLDIQVDAAKKAAKQMADAYEASQRTASRISGNSHTRRNATGGFLSAGQTSIVGERGPEIITPNRSGYIIPNNKIGGGVNLTIVVNGDVTGEDLMERIGDTLVGKLKLSNAIQ